MNEPWVVVSITIAAIVILRWLALFVLAGGEFQRVRLAERATWRVAADRGVADKVRQVLEPPPPAPPPKPSGEPLRLLAVLQRDSRFLDFFMDDINAVGDEQILAFVKKMHPECQVSLKDHLALEPVKVEAEGDSVEVPAGFDPSVIRLLGNVTGEPPFRGTLRHRGWRVKEIKLAPPPAGQDEFVVQPAEVYLP
jgi:hypothetical protein